MSRIALARRIRFCACAQTVAQGQGRRNPSVVAPSPPKPTGPPWRRSRRASHDGTSWTAVASERWPAGSSRPSLRFCLACPPDPTRSGRKSSRPNLEFKPPRLGFWPRPPVSLTSNPIRAAVTRVIAPRSPLRRGAGVRTTTQTGCQPDAYALFFIEDDSNVAPRRAACAAQVVPTACAPTRKRRPCVTALNWGTRRFGSPRSERMIRPPHASRA